MMSPIEKRKVGMAESWLPDLERTSGAKYEAIAAAIRSAIDSGALRPGERLPPQRTLAEALNVDLTTVTRAYEAMRRLGLIEARGRAGSFVSVPIDVPPADPGPVGPGMNMPPELPGALLATVMADTTRALLASNGASRLQYHPAGGTLQARKAGARILAARGLDCEAEQVLVTAGGQHALCAALHTAVRPGDAIACGAYVYPGFKALAGRMGLRLVPLPEISAQELERACRGRDIQALYVVPTNDNPTTHTIPASERARLAEISRQNGLQLIEDDAYGALSTQALPPLAKFAPERTWHIASMSKILSPALRVAFLHAPNIAHALSTAGTLHETAVMAPPLNVALVCAWLADGTFDRLVDEMRKEAAWRQASADRMLINHRRQRQAEGYHFWMPLPAGIDSQTLIDRMRPTGLSIVSSKRFAVEPGGPEAVRVSLGGLLDRDRLGSALRTLEGYLASPFNEATPLI
jgi:DNA-binding transcriptional MocR family regulator